MLTRPTSGSCATTLDELVLVHDGERIVWASDRLCSRLGYEPQRILGRPLAEILCLPGQDGADALLKRGGGEQLRCSARTYSLGHGLSTVVLTPGSACPRMAEVEAKFRWLAELSHEIRTPTVGIVGAADLLAATALNEEQHELVQTVLQSASWLVALLNNVLTHASLENATPELDLAPTSVRQLVDDIARQFSALALAKGVRWRSNVSLDTPAAVLADAGKLRQILSNLASNAMKMTQSGHIVLRVSRGGPARIRFEVEDTGPGVDPSLAERLFEAYAKGRRERRGHPSTGLGLSISRRLVELMGGAIGVVPNYPVGSIFWFEVDAAETSAASSSARVASLAKAAAEVLLVEDHDLTRTVATRMIESLGHRVLAVATGGSAIASAERTRFDLVLMDCDLPDVDGFEATWRIRRGRHADVPVVGFSADEPDLIRAGCREAGMDGCLAKPMRLADLSKAIDQYARVRAA